MSKIVLTGADIADLAAGQSFNTLTAGGEEIVVDGRDFSTDEVKALCEGGVVLYTVDGVEYQVTAPQEPSSAHRAA